MYAVWMAPGSTRMRGVEAEIDVIAGSGKANSLVTAFDTTAKSELLPLKRSGVPQFAEFVSNWISYLAPTSFMAVLCGERNTGCVDNHLSKNDVLLPEFEVGKSQDAMRFIF